MKITIYNPETEILNELAQRLARLRKVQGFTQVELAKEAVKAWPHSAELKPVRTSSL